MRVYARDGQISSCAHVSRSRRVRIYHVEHDQQLTMCRRGLLGFLFLIENSSAQSTDRYMCVFALDGQMSP